MNDSLRARLSGNRTARLSANYAYVYLIHMLHLVLDLCPWFVRNACFRLLMGKAGKGVFFDHRVYLKFPWLVEMGDNVNVNRGAEFYPDFFGRHKVVIGNNVRIAPHVRFHAASHDASDLEYRHEGATITVGDDVWIGAGAVILPGVTVGDRSIVGAGSVVSKDVPPDVVVAGVPAKQIRKRKAET